MIKPELEHTEKERIEAGAHMLHSQGEQTREGGDATAAIALHTKSLEAYTSTGNVLKQIELHASLCLDYRHLANAAQTDEDRQSFRAQALAEVEMSVAMIAQLTADDLAVGRALAHEHRGKFFVWNQQFARAADDFEIALTSIEETPADRRPEIYQQHYVQLQLHLARLLSGNAQSEEAVLATIQQLMDDVPEFDLPPKADMFDEVYNVKVWVSGAYLHLAQFFKVSSAQHARRYLGEAKDIITNDDRLIVRSKDLERVEKEMAQIDS